MKSRVFKQKIDEYRLRGMGRFNDLLRGCLHHGFSELHQLDTFYNALNLNDQDSLNSAAGGNFLDKMPQECLKIIEMRQIQRFRQSRSIRQVVCQSRVRAVLVYPKFMIVQAAAANLNQGNTGHRPQMVCKSEIFVPPGFPSRSKTFKEIISKYKFIGKPITIQNEEQFTNKKAKFTVPSSEEICINQRPKSLQNQLDNLTDMLSKFVISNTTSTSGSGTLPGNTITNPKEDLKGITTRSGVAYQGPAIPSTSSSSPKVMNLDTEVTKDTMLPTNNGSTEDVQPLAVQIQSHNPISKPVVDPVSAPMPNQRASIPFPSRRNDERRREKANDQIEKFLRNSLEIKFRNFFTDALTLYAEFA
ncbi:hypothetical protein Tco_0194730 [Tanacetum coccineum]